jgi:hypothetical protein
MKQFVILPQWSEEDLISFTDCASALLVADSMTKREWTNQIPRAHGHYHWDEEIRCTRRQSSRIPQSTFFF